MTADKIIIIIINKRRGGGRAPKSTRHEKADTLFGVIPENTHRFPCTKSSKNDEHKQILQRERN